MPLRAVLNPLPVELVDKYPSLLPLGGAGRCGTTLRSVLCSLPEVLSKLSRVPIVVISLTHSFVFHFMFYFLTS